MVGFIILGILLFLLILLSIPVGVTAEYSEELRLTLSYLFIKIKLLPGPEENEKKAEKEKKKKSRKKKKEKEEKPEKAAEKGGIKDSLKKIIEAKGVRGFLDIIYEMLKIILRYTGRLLRHIKLKKCDVYMLVTGDDASETALNYGKACSAVYPAISEICSFFRCGKPAVTVDFDYDAAGSSVAASAEFSLSPIIMAGILLKLGIKLLRPILRLRPQKKGK